MNQSVLLLNHCHGLGQLELQEVVAPSGGGLEVRGRCRDRLAAAADDALCALSQHLHLRVHLLHHPAHLRQRKRCREGTDGSGSYSICAYAYRPHDWGHRSESVNELFRHSAPRKRGAREQRFGLGGQKDWGSSYRRCCRILILL